MGFVPIRSTKSTVPAVNVRSQDDAQPAVVEGTL